MSVYAEAVTDFKRAFLRHHLSAGESVAKTAARLGLARTYLVRLKRDLGVEGRRPSPGRPRAEPKATAP